MFSGIFFLVIKSMHHRKLRTFLTVLGVVIGVAAIVGMVGATKGISEMINSELEKFQSDVIEVIPGKFDMGMSMGLGGPSARLTERDVDEIKRIPGVEISTGSISRQVSLGFNGKEYVVTAMGIDPEDFKEINTIGLYEGRYPSKNGHEVILGYNLAKDTFDKEIKLRKTITINGEDFKVVGIMNKAGGMFRSMDTLVFVPKEPLKEVLNLNTDDVYVIDVKVKSGFDIEEIGDNIERRLCRLHRSCDDLDFTVFTPEFAKSIASKITSFMQILLGGIAGISLVVGAIGISNMMFTSVLERIKEIGILKAIGATDKDVMLLFLIESGIIGLIGGVIGVISGWGLGEGFLFIRKIMIEKSGFTVSQGTPHVYLSLEWILFVLIFSFIVGVLSGYFPARKAAKLQPVEALRWE